MPMSEAHRGGDGGALYAAWLRQAIAWSLVLGAPAAGATASGWTPTTITGAPAARSQASAVWTGTEMIVWGGYPITGTGGRYDPAADSWAAVSTALAPPGSYQHAAVWTGTEMIVWGLRRVLGLPWIRREVRPRYRHLDGHRRCWRAFRSQQPLGGLDRGRR